MPQLEIDKYNLKYSHAGRVEFGLDQHGQARVRLDFNEAYAMVYLQGAHVTACHLGAGADLLWVSQSANYQPGKAIRGGIPLCWPWFGAHPSRVDRSQHGYARTSEFQVVETRCGSEDTSIQLRLAQAVPEYPEWQAKGKIELNVTIRLSDALWMQVSTLNHSTVTVPLSLALHNYFLVGDASQVSISGMQGLHYSDKLNAGERRKQLTALRIDQAMDRIYLDPPSSVVIRDPTLDRQILVHSWCNKDLVVWNPGAAGAEALADFDDSGYKSMVCVEPALALDNRVLLEPGGSHEMGQIVSSVQGADVNGPTH